jgi:hypothetical protein
MKLLRHKPIQYLPVINLYKCLMVCSLHCCLRKPMMWVSSVVPASNFPTLSYCDQMHHILWIAILTAPIRAASPLKQLLSYFPVRGTVRNFVLKARTFQQIIKNTHTHTHIYIYYTHAHCSCFSCL